MAWGWTALIGTGAAVLGGFFTGGLSWGLLAAGAAGFVGGAGIGGVADKIIKNFGDTPTNQLKNLGVNPAKLHEEAKEYREKKTQFLDTKNKEDKQELDKIEKKIDSLEDSINNLFSDIANPNIDANEKAQKIALMNQKKEQKTQLVNKADEIKKNIKERNDKIDKVFQELGNPVEYTATAYNQKADSPSLKSWFNWGIIIAAIVVFGILVSVLKKFLNNMVNSFSK